MAQDQGFEPWHRFPDLRAFQARPFNRLGNPALLYCLSSLQQIKMKSKHYFISIVITHETNRDFKARFVYFQNVAYTYILYI